MAALPRRVPFMPTDVVMPQLGESIFEGTITKWLKRPGDAVQKDEPLFEISTDKVDAEIPSPVSGTLSEIKAAEGETVEVNTVVAVIAEAAAPAKAPAPGKKPEPAAAPATPAEKRQSTSKAEPAETAKPQSASKAESATSASSDGTEVVMPQLGESIFEGTITQVAEEGRRYGAEGRAAV